MRHGFGRRARACGFALALGIGSVQITCPVYADTTDDAVARSRPEYDAQGIPLGIFRLFPSVTLATSFDDNIDRRETNTLSDVFFTFSPSAALRSQWSQDALNLSASSDTLVYSRYSSENITNYNFKGYGQLDVLRSFRITSDASFARLHVLRSSPELALNAVSPLPYSQTHVDVSAEYQPSDLDIIVGVDFDHYDYGAVDLVGGGRLAGTIRIATSFSRMRGYPISFPRATLLTWKASTTIGVSSRLLTARVMIAPPRVTV